MLRIIFLFLLILAACSGSSQEATPTPIPQDVAPIAATFEVQVGDLDTQIQFNGRIIPAVSQNLSFGTDGHVREVYIQEDEFVSEGDVIADLDVIANVERQRERENVPIRRAEIRLEIARLQLELTEAQDNSDIKDIQVAIKEQELALAELALDEVNLNMPDWDTMINNATLTAAMDGTLLDLDINVGDTVTAFESVGEIADTSGLELAAALRSDQLEVLQEGLPVTVAPINRPGVAITGVITKLPENTFGEDTDAIITFDSSPSEIGLEIGNRAQVTAVLERREGVLWLPPQAIRQFSGRNFVVVRDGNAEVRVDVEVGLRSRDRVEIVAGLEEGQTVVGP